uniref:Uncharacterized protein n=1 Tax=Peronospora matthiolae TaxID=2874970 RepID=A0AAV1TMG8_9STRA
MLPFDKLMTEKTDGLKCTVESIGVFAKEVLVKIKSVALVWPRVAPYQETPRHSTSSAAVEEVPKKLVVASSNCEWS